jgi:hypothetical protein
MSDSFFAKFLQALTLVGLANSLKEFMTGYFAAGS